MRLLRALGAGAARAEPGGPADNRRPRAASPRLKLAQATAAPLLRRLLGRPRPLAWRRIAPRTAALQPGLGPPRHAAAGGGGPISSCRPPRFRGTIPTVRDSSPSRWPSSSSGGIGRRRERESPLRPSDDGAWSPRRPAPLRARRTPRS
jgi:hypothetical protein